MNIALHPIALVLAAQVGQLPIEEAAKHLLTIAGAAGFPGRVACRDIDMTVALKKQGISTDPRSSIAWAATAAQVQAFLSDGKLVVCGEKSLLHQGAAIALVSEGGHLVIYLHQGNATKSGVPIPDSLLKISRRVG
jgi:hypothetical protein